MALKTFDPQTISLIIGGLPMGGFADGTFITFEYDEDTFTKTQGADGESTRVKSNNNDGILTLTLAQSSDSNIALSGLAELDRLSNSGVVPVLLKEISGLVVTATSIASAQAYIMKRPSVGYSKEISTREWPIAMVDVIAIIGGN